MAFCAQGRLVSRRNSLSLTERDANCWAFMFSLSPKHRVQQHEKPVPSHSTASGQACGDMAGLLSWMCRAGLSWVTGESWFWSPQLWKGKCSGCPHGHVKLQIHCHCFKYFTSKDPNKEFQNCLIITDVYQEYQNGEDFQKMLSKYLLKTWSPVSQTESQDHQTLQKSPIWSSVAVFPQLPFFKLEFARLVCVSWFAGIEKKCPVNTLLPWSWQQSGLTSKTVPAEKGQETV